MSKNFPPIECGKAVARHGARRFAQPPPGTLPKPPPAGPLVGPGGRRICTSAGLDRARVANYRARVKIDESIGGSQLPR
jgi:hypothetical protein